MFNTNYQGLFRLVWNLYLNILLNISAAITCASAQTGSQWLYAEVNTVSKTEWAQEHIDLHETMLIVTF